MLRLNDNRICPKCGAYLTENTYCANGHNVPYLLWKRLGDVPIRDDDTLDADFQPFKDVIFHKGTDRSEVWHWFEETFNLSVAEDLMKLK